MSDSDSDSFSDTDYYLGSLFTQIVGIRYYHGIVSVGEFVRLAREPSNPYDTNAIRVDNTSGVQIGHIAAANGHARELSPLIDRCAGELSVEAFVTQGGAFKLSVRLTFFAPNRDAALRDLALLTALSPSLQFSAEVSPRGEPVLASESETFAQLMVSDRALPSARGRRASRAAPAPLAKAVSESAVLAALRRSDAFYSVCSPYDAHAPFDEGCIADKLLTPLLDHQRRAVTWMMARERPTPVASLFVPDAAASASSASPPSAGPPSKRARKSSASTTAAAPVVHPEAEVYPEVDSAVKWFWRSVVDKGQPLYENILTNRRVDGAHPLVSELVPQGGILADAMGLGKTLSVLTLILSQKSTTSGPTLVVVPASVMSAWILQMQQHFVPGSISWVVYHGPDRTTARFSEADVVLTTYDLLSADLSRLKSMASAPWARVILDEGHQIANRNTKKSQSCAAVQASCRWVLTGTPLQNGVADLFSLVRFIGRTELASWDVFQNTVIRPTRRRDATGLVCLRMFLSYCMLRRSKHTQVGDPPRPLVLLPTRQRRVVTVGLSLRQKTVYFLIYALVIKHFGAVLSRTGRTGAESAHQAVSGNLSYMHVLAGIGRLRAAASDIRLLPADLLASLDPIIDDTAPLIAAGGEMDLLSAFREDIYSPAAGSSDELTPVQKLHKALDKLGKAKVDGLLEKLEALGEEDSCVICLEGPAFAEMTITPCGHYFHHVCIMQFIEKNPRSTACPLCRVAITANELIVRVPPAPEEDAENCHPTAHLRRKVSVNSEPVAPVSAEPAPIALADQSSKIAWLQKYLLSMPADEKLVVISTFKKLLDNVAQAIGPCLRIDGTVPTAKRYPVLQKFEESNEPDHRVILITLGAAGVGLNLTRANHAVLMDPCWNPAAEEQAFDRIYRIGQTRPVIATKLIADGTLEARVSDVAARKATVATAVTTDRSVGTAFAGFEAASALLEPTRPRIVVEANSNPADATIVEEVVEDAEEEASYGGATAVSPGNVLSLPSASSLTPLRASSTGLTSSSPGYRRIGSGNHTPLSSLHQRPGVEGSQLPEPMPIRRRSHARVIPTTQFDESHRWM